MQARAEIPESERDQNKLELLQAVREKSQMVQDAESLSQVASYIMMNTLHKMSTASMSVL